MDPEVNRSAIVGVQPPLLFSAVKNTAPFIFDFDRDDPHLLFAKIIRDRSERLNLSLPNLFGKR
jgi:hypothetical protein